MPRWRIGAYFAVLVKQLISVNPNPRIKLNDSSAADLGISVSHLEDKARGAGDGAGGQADGAVSASAVGAVPDAALAALLHDRGVGLDAVVLAAARQVDRQPRSVFPLGAAHAGPVVVPIMTPTTPEEIAERYRELVPQPLPLAECRPSAGRYRLQGAYGTLLNCEFCPQPRQNCVLSCALEFDRQTSNDGITVTT